MTWLSWLSHCIIFSNKRNNELTDYIVSFVWFFLFNQSKNNAILEPRTGHFRELVVFEAKDLSFEAEGKNLKMCPRGKGIHLSLVRLRRVVGREDVQLTDSFVHKQSFRLFHIDLHLSLDQHL